ncbi:hypothetical protein BGZ88_005595, partial [Linnemannia elongata]
PSRFDALRDECNFSQECGFAPRWTPDALVRFRPEVYLDLAIESTIGNCYPVPWLYMSEWYLKLIGRRFQFPNTYLPETKDDNDMPYDDLPATVLQELTEEIEDDLGADASDFSDGDGELNFYYQYNKQGLSEGEGGYPD